jgi:hypothetical protein
MSGHCFIVPPHLLKAIADSTHNLEEEVGPKVPSVVIMHAIFASLVYLRHDFAFCYPRHPCANTFRIGNCTSLTGFRI